ncbi:MAG: transcriptional regulator, IclR family [Microbacterium sp.]|uniref:IclR family transcriptional regulator n=1 Tax=Microbacterium sp. TaxID=51671 RepID=UPI002621290B|nr:IclR family transcriptional regulator [Microbacterium sp.]MDF2561871.1 transcriptional regulator, IclR family [Microbacterium sp.]
MTTADRSVPGTQSIDRALSLLSAFSPERPRQRVADLVAATGLGQSTVSRMVSAMTALGFLRHHPQTGMYSLGAEVVNLAGIMLNDHPVHSAARQVAQSLAARLGTGVNVAERADAHLSYLCNFEGADAPRNSTLIGRGGPLHATAMGKALLIGKSQAEITAILGSEFDRYTVHTITDVDALADEVALVAERGYATENEELALRRACIAAPIRDRSGEVVAAVSISGPLSVLRMNEREEELAMILIEQADLISTALGYVARVAAVRV